LLQDSQLSISGIISENLGTRLARIQNTHFTTGTGTTLPYGVVAKATEGVVTADSSSALTYANFVDLYHSVDPAYRGNAIFMMADSTLALVKKMVDTTGRPLWMPSMAAGSPDTILGKPVVVNNDVAAKAATAKCVLFGDFDKYIIRDCSETVIRVLNERWAETGSVGFVALHRADGNLLNTSAIKYLQVHA
jgi:HK97 family phage major capsid protein